MKHIYSIFDVKTASYLEPFVASNDEEAQRKFCNILLEVRQMANHSQDYELRSCGVWDSDTGEVSPNLSRHVVVNGLHLVNQYNESMRVNHESQKRDDASVQPSSESEHTT